MDTTDIETKLANAMEEPKNVGKPDTDEEVDMTFTKELRQATKDVHKMSDVLVNAKFAFALTSDTVWADGLLAFYEIYKFFEKNLPEELLPSEFHRTEWFEKDLQFFLGEKWQDTYEIRPSVRKYLAHLEKVNEKSKVLLFAYAYQMYMALMSGGQLLQKKRMIARKLWIFKKNENEETEDDTTSIDTNDTDDLQARPMPKQVTLATEGCLSTFFPQKISIMKNKLRRILNEQCKQFDAKMRANFIEESRNVFIFNSEVVRSIKGVNYITYRRLAVAFTIVLGVYVAIQLAKM